MGDLNLKFSYFAASCSNRSILLLLCWEWLNSVCLKKYKIRVEKKGVSHYWSCSCLSSVCHIGCLLMLDATQETSLKFCSVLVEVLLLFTVQSDSSSSFAEVTSSIST